MQRHLEGASGNCFGGPNMTGWLWVAAVVVVGLALVYLVRRRHTRH